MNKIPSKTKLTAASIGVLMAIVLTVGGTFAWLTLSKAPEVKDMNVKVANTTILEIAQAYPENYLTGPPEVGENDDAKRRVVNGQTVHDQGVWGRVVDMTDTQIILQEPATFDEQTKALSTIKFDRTGRTNGLEKLTKQEISDDGIVYFTKRVESGNYRGEDGYIHTASISMTEDSPEYIVYASPSDASPSTGLYTPPTDVKCAGGVAVWMRSNRPTSEQVLLKGLKLSKATDSQTGSEPVSDEDILGVIVNTYHLSKTDGAKAIEKKTGIPQEGTLEPFNSYYAQKTDKGYVCTMFAGSAEQQMQAGEPYLVEIICYIEGDRENAQGNTAAISDNSGTSRRVTFETIECKDVMYAAKVTNDNDAPRHKGWFAGHTALKIELFGASDEVDSKNIIIDYKTTTAENPEATISELSGSFMAFNSSGAKNSATIELDDGSYLLTVSTTQTDEEGNPDPTAIKYYTVSVGDTSMVNTVEDSISVKVDTIKPVVSAEIESCGCAYQEPDGTTYHNHDVTVIGTAVEKNPEIFSIGGMQIPAATLSQSGDVCRGERVYAREGDYTANVVVTDRSGKTNDPNTIDPATSRKAGEVHFIVDKTEPKVTSVRWGFVNNDGTTTFLNGITGAALFDKKVLLQVITEDEHNLELGLSDSTGPLNANIVKDPDGRTITATVELPKNYKDDVKITAKDKAGNVLNETAGQVYISGDLPYTEETHDGYKSKPDEDPVVWYDITYHLTPADPNAARVTGFEFSDDGIHWYSTDRHIGKVNYKVKTTDLNCDTVTIYCDDYEEARGIIHFRAVTDIVTGAARADSQYAKGMVLYRSYRLEAKSPEVPVAKAFADGNSYVAGIPTQGPIEYKLSGGESYQLEVDHYEFSLDCAHWKDKDFEQDFIKVEVSGDKNETITVHGVAGTDSKSQIFFRTVASKESDPSILVKGPATAINKYEIDRRQPVFFDAQWGHINSSNFAKAMRKLTGDLFFNEMVKVEVKAMDANIDKVICTKYTADNEKTADDTITARVYVDPDFDGTLTFAAVDTAGNTSTFVTSRLAGSDLRITVVPYTSGDGHEGRRYELSLMPSVNAAAAKYEYSTNVGRKWNETATEDKYFKYGFDQSVTGIHEHVMEVESKNIGTPSSTEPPATVDFRVTVTDPGGTETVFTAENTYIFDREWP